MEAYFAYLDERFAALTREADALASSDRKDESNLTKIRANIYDVCRTVCRVHLRRPDGIERCRNQFRVFETQWGGALDKAAAHGDVEKEFVERLKLEALADVKAKFEEAAE